MLAHARIEIEDLSTELLDSQQPLITSLCCSGRHARSLRIPRFVFGDHLQGIFDFSGNGRLED
jgi:hypothetical protein